MAEEKKRGRGRPKKKKEVEQDLPGVDGPGVGLVQIPEVNRAAGDYFRKKEARCEMTPEEVKAKKKLMDLLHAHEDKIGRDADGVLRYTFEDKVVMLSPGEDHLTVKRAKKVELEED